MLGPVLLLGFLLGLRHALDADHVAAVATLATRSRSVRDHVRLAGAWGLGHAATVVGLGTAVIALGLSLPGAVTRGLELAVGVMLVALGVDVFRRLGPGHVHVHAHRHDEGGPLHLHAHRHVTGQHHGAHDHAHAEQPLGRALLVGGVHGLAGTGAAALVALQGAASQWQALGYLVVFAVGSVLGMMALSAAISLPLRSVRPARSAALALRGSLGALSVGLGCWIVVVAVSGLG